MKSGSLPKSVVEAWSYDKLEVMSLTLTTLPTATEEVVIFDTEYTTWEGSRARGWSAPGEYREVVQIAAQRIDLASGAVQAEFAEYVHPRINNTLSTFFIELTGITQDTIDTHGRDFLPVYREFVSWVGECAVYSYGSSKASDGDILAENLALYDLAEPYDATRYHNLRPLFQAAGIPVEQYSSGQLYQAFNLSLSGHVHNAMHDVRSLAQSLLALKGQLNS